MTDPITLAIAAYLSEGDLSTILGPTAEHLGDEIKTFTPKQIKNVGEIFSNAEKKLDNKLYRSGQVPFKVLKTIIDEGSYSDDEIAVEYFGGVLASSKTEVDRDDRGARVAKIINNLSTYQIRSHYLIYSTISELFSNSGNSFNIGENRAKMQLFMSYQDYTKAMAITELEWNEGQILGHIFHGLAAEELIANDWKFGPQESLNTIVGSVPSAGIVCTPTALGVELLLWAFGQGDKEFDFLLTSDFSSEIEGIPKSVSNAVGAKT
jgi:hypothetical protein